MWAQRLRRARFIVWIGLGLLALIWTTTRMVRARDEQLTIRQIERVHRAVGAFRRDFGRCPQNLGELTHPPRAGLRYLHERPRDAWGRALWIRCPDRRNPLSAEVISAGPSGDFLTDDNIY